MNDPLGPSATPTLTDRAVARARLPLVRNAALLMGNSGVTAALGFVFWALAARLYVPSQVGLASATIAAALFVATITLLGLPYVLVRFRPDAARERAALNSTVIIIVSIAGIVVGGLFAAGVSVWEPSLLALAPQGALAVNVMLIAGATCASTALLYVAVAARNTHPALAGGIAHGVVKSGGVLAFAIVVPGLGFAIVVAWLLGTIAAVGVQLVALRKNLAPVFRPALLRHEGILEYSASNYVGDIMWTAPGLLFPLMVVSLLGAEANAYFYVAWSIAGLLVAIPTAVANSLLAEASHEVAEAEHHMRRAFGLTLLLVIPGIVATWLVAPYLLELFGAAYAAEGLEMLRLLALTALPLSVNLIFLTRFRADRATRWILAVTASTGLGSLVLAAVLASRSGELGIAIGYLVANGVVATALTIRWWFGRPRQA